MYVKDNTLSANIKFYDFLDVFGEGVSLLGC